MQIYGRKFVTLCYHTGKFDDDKHFYSLKEKYFINNINLKKTYYNEKGEKNLKTLKTSMLILIKSAQKLKNIVFHHLSPYDYLL